MFSAMNRSMMSECLFGYYLKRLFEKDSLKCSSKVLVENCVDNRVQGRVAVAKPEGEREAPCLNAARGIWVLLTQRADG